MVTIILLAGAPNSPADERSAPGGAEVPGDAEGGAVREGFSGVGGAVGVGLRQRRAGRRVPGAFAGFTRGTGRPCRCSTSDTSVSVVVFCCILCVVFLFVSTTAPTDGAVIVLGSTIPAPKRVVVGWGGWEERGVLLERITEGVAFSETRVVLGFSASSSYSCSFGVTVVVIVVSCENRFWPGGTGDEATGKGRFFPSVVALFDNARRRLFGWLFV